MNAVLEKPSPQKSQKENKVQPSPASGSIASVTTFSGPIPPPDFLAQYERLVPGIAEKFLEEPHLEAEHRRSLEKMVVLERIRLSKRGQWMAFFLATIAIVAAFVAIFYEHDIAGLGVLFLSIASFVGIFIYSRKQQG